MLGLPGLEEALAQVLPRGLRIDSLRLDAQALRLEGRVPVGKGPLRTQPRLVLEADVSLGPGRLALQRFRIQGPLGKLGMSALEGRLREGLSTLDRTFGPLHAWGEPDGERLVLAWDAGD